MLLNVLLFSVLFSLRDTSFDQRVSESSLRQVFACYSERQIQLEARIICTSIKLPLRLPNLWSSNTMAPIASSVDVLAPAHTPTSIDNVRLTAIQLLTGACLPGVIAALVRLQVFEALSRAGPNASLTAAEIAAQALPGKPINLTYLSRLLRLVSSKRILRETVTTTDSSDVVTERRYALEPVGHYFVDDPVHGSFVHMLLIHQTPHFGSTWQHLHEAVVDDEVTAFARGHGGLSAWEYAKQNAEFNECFNKAMSAHSKIYLKAVLDEYKGLEEVNVLVDVGGGLGSAMKQVTERYAHIRAINFDQPHVISACQPYPRVEHVGGNMFESVPKDGDAIFMKYILHDWDDESCVKILKKCYEALPLDGKVIALDSMLPEIINCDGAETLAFQSDTMMMAFNDSGARERTKSDYRKLGLAAGFRTIEVACKVDMIAVTEFRK